MKPPERLRSDKEIFSRFAEFSFICKRIATIFPVPTGDVRHLRRMILTASALKIERQLKAIVLLSEINCLEEVCGLTRIIVEVVINAVYLQDAEDQEVMSFLYFDGQKISSNLARDALRAGDAESARYNEANRADTQIKTGRKGDELSWSRRSPKQRANFVDERAPFAALARIQDSVSRVSNFSMHGTFFSIAHYITLDTVEDPFPQRNALYLNALDLLTRALEILAFQVKLRVEADDTAQAASADRHVPEQSCY